MGFGREIVLWVQMAEILSVAASGVDCVGDVRARLWDARGRPSVCSLFQLGVHRWVMKGIALYREKQTQQSLNTGKHAVLTSNEMNE